VRDDRRVSALPGANLALEFLLELAAFPGFAWWGATVGDGAVSVGILALASGALGVVAGAAAGLVLGALVALNAVLLTAFGQWEL
jgi:hypothetical protein